MRGLALLVSARGGLMRPMLLVMTMLCAVEAHAATDFYGTQALENCAMHSLGRIKNVEVCAASLPVNEHARNFEVAFRDPEKLEPGNPQTAPHKLIARLAVPTEKDEYMHYMTVAVYDVTPDLVLLVVPIVSGTPEAVAAQKQVLFTYDVKKLTFKRLWDSPACHGDACVGQNVTVATKKGGGLQKVLVETGTGKNAEIVFDGKAFKLPR